MDKEQLQPSGIDVRLQEAHRIQQDSFLWLAKDSTKHATREEQFIIPNQKDGKSFYKFHRGVPYSIKSYEFVKVPPNVIAIVYGRSTLNRNGILCRSSIYEPGYHDFVEFTLYPFINFQAERSVRIAQIIFYPADSCFLYNGQYVRESEYSDYPKGNELR
jgi:deoxycytidine triphosphate deaminase